MPRTVVSVRLGALEGVLGEAEMNQQIERIQSCYRCENVIQSGQTHCVCGRPTMYSSFEERAAFEVAAWREHREHSRSV